jgi:hypothetical protein
VSPSAGVALDDVPMLPTRPRTGLNPLERKQYLLRVAGRG